MQCFLCVLPTSTTSLNLNVEEELMRLGRLAVVAATCWPPVAERRGEKALDARLAGEKGRTRNTSAEPDVRRSGRPSVCLDGARVDRALRRTNSSARLFGPNPTVSSNR
jgi:hypothetical protein